MGAALGMGIGMAKGCELHNWEGVKTIVNARLWPLISRLEVQFKEGIESAKLAFDPAQGEVLAFVGTDDGEGKGGGRGEHPHSPIQSVGAELSYACTREADIHDLNPPPLAFPMPCRTP